MAVYTGELTVPSGGVPLFCTNWRQDPPTPQRVVLTSQPDGTALVYGWTAGQVCIKCTYEGLTLCTPTSVVNTYSLTGQFGFTNPSLVVDRPHEQRVDLLYQDDFGSIVINNITYSYYQSAETDGLGYWTHTGIGFDDIALQWWAIGRDVVVYSFYPDFGHTVSIAAADGPIDGPQWVVQTNPDGTTGNLGELQLQDLTSPKNANGAWSVANILQDGWNYVNANLAFSPPTVRAEWNATWNISTATSTTPPYLIRVAGVNPGTPYRPNNDDSFDVRIVLHEYGHVVGLIYSGAPVDGCPGGHGYWQGTDPACAYEEGWAHFFGGAVTPSNPVYHDLESWNLATPVDHIEFDLELSTSDPPPTATGPASEFSVATSLWDVYDTSNDFSGTNNDASGAKGWTGISSIWHVLTHSIGDEAIPLGEWEWEPNSIIQFLHGWKTNIANAPRDGLPIVVPYTYTPSDHEIFLDIFAAKSIDYQGFYPTDLREDSQVPSSTSYALQGAKPNPFNANTSVHFSVPQKSGVAIKVFDSLGRSVRTLYDGDIGPGHHSIPWNGLSDRGQPVPSGIYLIEMKSATFVGSAKAIVVK